MPFLQTYRAGTYIEHRRPGTGLLDLAPLSLVRATVLQTADVFVVLRTPVRGIQAEWVAVAFIRLPVAAAGALAAALRARLREQRAGKYRERKQGWLRRRDEFVSGGSDGAYRVVSSSERDGS
jgi:hypothetical protein